MAARPLFLGRPELAWQQVRRHSQGPKIVSMRYAIEKGLSKRRQMMEKTNRSQLEAIVAHRFRSIENIEDQDDRIAAYIDLGKKLMHTRSLEPVLWLARQMLSVGIRDAKHYTKFFRGLADRHRILYLERLADMMRSDGVDLDGYCYGRLLFGYGTRGMSSAANKTFRELISKQITPEIYHFNPLIMAYANANNIPAAKQWIERMRNYDTLPNNATSNILLNAYVESGRLETLVEFFEELKQTSTPPDIRGYGIMIKGFGWRNQIDKAEHYFSELRKHYEPTTAIYNTLLSIYRRHGHHSKFQALLTEMLDTTTLNAITTRIIMESAEDTSSTFQELFNTYAKLKESSAPFNLESMNIMLARAQRERDQESALWTAQEIERLGLFVDATSYNTCMTKFAKLAHVDGVMMIWKVMERNGILPDEVSWTILMTAYEKARKYEMAVQTFQTMTARGIRCNAIGYCVLFTAVARGPSVHNHIVKVDWLRVFDESGVDLNYKLSTALIFMYSKRLMVHEAENVLLTMMKAGSQPTVRTLTPLIKAYSKLGTRDKVDEWKRWMRAHGIKMDELLMNSLLIDPVQNGEWEAALRDIEENDMEMTPRLFVRMLQAFRTADRFDKLLEFAEREFKKGLKLNGTACCAMLTLVEELIGAERNIFSPALIHEVISSVDADLEKKALKPLSEHPIARLQFQVLLNSALDDLEAAVRSVVDLVLAGGRITVPLAIMLANTFDAADLVKRMRKLIQSDHDLLITLDTEHQEADAPMTIDQSMLNILVAHSVLRMDGHRAFAIQLQFRENGVICTDETFSLLALYGLMQGSFETLTEAFARAEERAVLDGFVHNWIVELFFREITSAVEIRQQARAQVDEDGPFSESAQPRVTLLDQGEPAG